MFALSWLLFFVSSVSAAAIPVPFHHHSIVDVKESPEVLAPNVLTPSPFSQSARHGDSSPLAKREPYYFPETIPSEDEVEERLISLREAGFMKGSSADLNHKQQIKSINAPDAVIDIPPALRMLPDREPSSDSNSHDSTTALTLNNSPILCPPLKFFAFVVIVTCIATIIRGVKNDEKPAIVLNV